jgi:serine/threonine-protein kinase
MIAGRFRIVSRLGVGGMGIVYRAEDLTLNQPVAIKFLPNAVATNPVWLARFRNEARLARSITHPNVCRVHDIAEADGEHFITMEFVPGEDLAHLLKRIGRLSAEKAVDIARQICAGLASAHRAGVLHRDLKPANIMLDAEGSVRITDFGIAALSGQISAREIRSGTPAYMAPEQISGRDVTAQSDIYALGLVLYELFSGCQAFQATTVDEYLQLHEAATPRPLSELVGELPEGVEEAVNRCLRKQPEERPRSALHVAAALPGTDVLRVALESGVTPSPDLIAAAPAVNGRNRNRWRLALAGAAFLALLVVLRSVYPLQWDNLGATPPAALAERARRILETTGLGIPHADEAFGYCTTQDAWWEMTRAFAGHEAERRLVPASPSEPCFFFRQSVRPLIPQTMESVFWRAGYVTPADPPPNDSDSRVILFDAAGRLMMLGANAGYGADPAGDAVAKHQTEVWDELFRAAGIVPTQTGAPDAPAPTGASLNGCTQLTFAQTQPFGTPASIAVGCWSRDRLGFFATGSPGSTRSQQPVVGMDGFSGQQRVVAMLQRVLFLLLLAVAVPLGIARYRSVKTEYSTAVRLAFMVVLLETVAAVLRLGSSASLYDAVSRLCVVLVRSAGVASLLGLCYVAVDGYARRYWPHLLVTWNRLLLGRFTDLGVRYHTLVGACVGCWWGLLAPAERAVVSACGWNLRPMFTGDRIAEKLHGFGAVLASYCGCAEQALLLGLLFLFMLVVLRAAVLNPNRTVAVCALLLAAVVVPRGANFYTSLLSIGLGGAVVGAWVMARFGLLAIVVAMFVSAVLNSTSMNLSTHTWTFGISLCAVLIVVCMLVWGATGRLAPRR